MYHIFTKSIDKLQNADTLQLGKVKLCTLEKGLNIMAKTERKIFQPDALTSMLIDGACDKDKGGTSISDLANSGIKALYTPYNEALRKETNFIFHRVINEEQIEPEELKATLARCVDILKNHPISDVSPLEQIFIHFTFKRGRRLRYDYVQLVDEEQDLILHRLNDILKTVDEDFTYGTREFGERSRYVFEHWVQLCSYSEIYTALSTIIECEDIYYPLDIYRTVFLIKWLDSAINESSLTPIKEPFETSITLNDRYNGVRYEVSVYLTDSGYEALSGDSRFEHIPENINKYLQKCMQKHNVYGEASEADLDESTALEKEGRMLFRRLNKPPKK